MTGWWKRNAPALVAIAVILPVGAYAVDTIEFGYVRNTPVRIAEGESYRVGDWIVGPVTIESLDADAVDAPPGTDPVVVTIRIDPGHDDFICQSPTIVDASSGRTWRSRTDLAWAPADDQLTYCASDTVVPYDIAHAILLSGGLGEHLDVVVPVSGDDQILDLRFVVSR